jgi:tRNA A-37 threonylcarbamoyl transferase component Bud32
MQLATYMIIRELSSRSFLARDASGRQVVLKMLPADCLLEGQLNPNIAERLRRVREIAMTDVANLRGVEREGDRVFLVWDFVEGESFDAVATAALARQLVHTVTQFHTTGLVHGALHGRNVLVDSGGRIRLIDVSPLLFLDPDRDDRAVREMCGNLLLEGNLTDAREAVSTSRMSLRRRTLIAALVMILIGAGLCVTIDRMVRRSRSAPLTPPRLSK